MKKYIHYCWFGDKKLPKLAKKCIKSWKKYLPDYEIICWSEKNTNLNECAFVKEAYQNKKWAFVSDYVRTKALNEMGGIYFDTDMELLKDISYLLDKETILGLEDSGYVAVGFWYEKHKNSLISSELLKIYKSFNSFDVSKMSQFSIPILISKVLNKYNLKIGSKELQILNNNIYIYPREYFYPYSYNRENNLFTSETCMIHYYDASWIPLKERIENNMIRKMGRKKTFIILYSYRKLKFLIRKFCKILLFPIVLYKKHKNFKSNINATYFENLDNTLKLLNNYCESDYIVLYNKNWLGVSSATNEIFDNLVPCVEIYRKKDAKVIAKMIVNTNINQIIFSSFAYGWKDLIIYIKKYNKNIKIKTFWHGSYSQVLDSYGWQRHNEIINLHKKKYIDKLSICKKSMLNFYLKNNFNSCFLTNKVDFNIKGIKTRNNSKDKIKIGLYAAKCDDWRKNMFSQIAAVSLIDNAILDIVPLTDVAVEFSKMLGVDITGIDKSLSRTELINRMSSNDINLYITYSECSPMLPLESMENNVMCLTGNNHHYFEGTKLEDYLVLNNESNIIDIKNKIMYALKNKDYILKQYKLFSKNNKKESRILVNKFLEK